MSLVSPRSVTDTVDDPRWVPMRVTAHLGTAITTDTDPMHLDGPLSWCAYLDHQAAGGSLPPMTPEFATDFAIGLATWTRPASTAVTDPRWLAEDGVSTWGWACSAGFAPPLLRTVTYVRRPVSTRELVRYTQAKSVHTGAGPHKARNVPCAALLAPEVTWWCLGDPDRVRSLLGRLRGVGRMSRHGNGEVLSVDVVEDPQARDRWMWRQWPDLTSPHMGACRAPYHHPTRRMPVTRLGAPPWA